MNTETSRDIEILTKNFLGSVFLYFRNCENAEMKAITTAKGTCHLL
jgi:hypothetical protein